MELDRRGGSDEAYFADPNSFLVQPVAVRPVVTRVLDVLATDGPRDAPGAPPRIEAGSSLAIYFPEAAGFEPGDHRIFFLRWTKMWLRDDTTTALLLVDVSQGSWVVARDGEAFPYDSGQRYSLVAGARRGDVRLAGTSCRPTLTLNGFADLVRTELSDRRPNSATFERWPPEPVYREVAEHNDLPDELLDPR